MLFRSKSSAESCRNVRLTAPRSKLLSQDVHGFVGLKRRTNCTARQALLTICLSIRWIDTSHKLHHEARRKLLSKDVHGLNKLRDADRYISNMCPCMPCSRRHPTCLTVSKSSAESCRNVAQTTTPRKFLSQNADICSMETIASNSFVKIIIVKLTKTRIVISLISNNYSQYMEIKCNIENISQLQCFQFPCTYSI